MTVIYKKQQKRLHTITQSEVDISLSFLHMLELTPYIRAYLTNDRFFFFWKLLHILLLKSSFQYQILQNK